MVPNENSKLFWVSVDTRMRDKKGILHFTTFMKLDAPQIPSF